MKGVTINAGRLGPQAGLSIPGTDVSWQFGDHRHVHKAVQVQADIRAVHAQGTVKSVEAQAEIIAITKRMEMVAKRLMKNVSGSNQWKKAAIEQAKLLDKILEVAKASENDQLISAVQRCHKAWADGNPRYREALDSGMTVTQCLAIVLAGTPPGQSASAKLSDHPMMVSEAVTVTNCFPPSTTNESTPKPHQLLPLKRKRPEPSIGETGLRPNFWNTLGHNLVFSVIGSGVTALVYAMGAHQMAPQPPSIETAAPGLEQAAALPALQTPAATPAPRMSGNPWPAVAMSAASPREQAIHGNLPNKPPTHNPGHRPER